MLLKQMTNKFVDNSVRSTGVSLKKKDDQKGDHDEQGNRTVWNQFLHDGGGSKDFQKLEGQLHKKARGS